MLSPADVQHVKKAAVVVSVARPGGWQGVPKAGLAGHLPFRAEHALVPGTACQGQLLTEVLSSSEHICNAFAQVLGSINIGLPPACSTVSVD